MNFCQTIATMILMTSLILSLQLPTSIRSPTRIGTLRRSLGVVVTLTLGTFIDSVATGTAQKALAFATLGTSHCLLIMQLRSAGSIWASRRIRSLSLAAGLTLALILSFGRWMSAEAYATLTVLGGARHLLNIRDENRELANIFIDLKSRIVTLQSDHFSIRSGPKTSHREARDIEPKAG